MHGSARDGDQPGERRSGFVQAPIRPLDEDGVVVAMIGTIGFALATAVMLILHTRLSEAGHGWWIWVGAVGTVLGVIGTIYCRRRARRA